MGVKRKVRQLDINGVTVKEFDSIKEAAESFGRQTNTIYQACLLKTRITKGQDGVKYKWEFVEKNEKESVLDYCKARFKDIKKRMHKGVFKINCNTETKAKTLAKMIPNEFDNLKVTRITRLRPNSYYVECERTDIGIKGKSSRYHIVYEVINPSSYRYGLCVGYGNNEEQAINDFFRSRRYSSYKHKVLYLSKNQRQAVLYESMMISKENGGI